VNGIRTLREYKQGNKFMKRNLLAWLISLIGIGVMAYPSVREFYYDYRQQRLLEAWQESLLIIDEAIHTENGSILSDETERDNLEQEGEQENKEYGAYIKQHMEGILVIPKIDLSMPILKGATEQNLNISISSLKNTGKPGEIGNYVLSGHRSHSYGRHFNRLDELEAGDIVEVNTGENNYKYIVVEKIYVKPEDTWVLNPTEKAREITLITCHPMLKPTHRLIIKGKLDDM
jgi:sortase A